MSHTPILIEDVYHLEFSVSNPYSLSKQAIND